MRLHLPPQNLVHVGLIPLTTATKPGEYVGIHAKTNKLLDWPVETAYLNVRRSHVPFWRVGKIDLGIGHSGELLQFSALFVSGGIRKERARRQSLFSPR